MTHKIDTNNQLTPTENTVDLRHPPTEGIEKTEIAVIYVYDNKKKSSDCQDNIAFFIKHGLDPSRWSNNIHITTLFVINDYCEAYFPDSPNIHTCYFNLDNLSIDDINNVGLIHLKILDAERSLNQRFSTICFIEGCSFGPKYVSGPNRHWFHGMDDTPTVYNRTHDVITLTCSTSCLFGDTSDRFVAVSQAYPEPMFHISDYTGHFTNIGNTKCVIYAHFDKDNVLRQYVIESLSFYSRLGYDIFFFTNSADIINYDISELPFSVHFYKKESTQTRIQAGTDWFMWIEGIRHMNASDKRYGHVLLTNDSFIVGINGFDNMKTTFDDMASKKIDLWGHHDSYELQYHLMSSFLHMTYEVSNTFLLFCENTLRKCRTSRDVVTQCEVVFAKHVKDKGFRIGTVVATDKFDNTVCTPSHNKINLHLWINKKNTFGIKWKYIVSNLGKKELREILNRYSRQRFHHIPIGPTKGVPNILP